MIVVLNNHEQWNSNNLGYRRLAGDILYPQIRNKLLKSRTYTLKDMQLIYLHTNT